MLGGPRLRLPGRVNGVWLTVVLHIHNYIITTTTVYRIIIITTTTTISVVSLISCLRPDNRPPSLRPFNK